MNQRKNHADDAVSLRRRLGDESGAVLVLFALMSSVTVVLMAFVLDVGNWFAHQRHLQLQADSAALAAAQSFNYPCTETVKGAMYKTAGMYAGVESVTTPEGNVQTLTAAEKAEREAKKEELFHNVQVGSTTQANVHAEINKKTFFGQSLQGQLSETTTVEKAPCEPEAGMVDVKLTETELPWFFQLFNVKNINAHARVAIRRETQATKVEPLIESEPIEVRVFYVNDTPEGCESEECYEHDPLLATGLLTNIGSNEEKGTIKWTDTAAPVPVKISTPHVGVRIALSGKEGALKGEGNEALSVCKHAYVECFDQDTVVPPLVNISGYSAEGEGKASPFKPVSHKVTLSTPPPPALPEWSATTTYKVKAVVAYENGDYVAIKEGSGKKPNAEPTYWQPVAACSDPYFEKAQSLEPKAACLLTVSAEVKYGSSSTTGISVQPETVYTEGFGGVSNASEEEKEPKQPQMHYESATGMWTGAVTVPDYFYGNFGSTEINLKVTCKKEAKSPCESSSNSEQSETLKDVQRTFSAGPDGSDRIVGAWVSEPGATNPVPGARGADAFELCEKADGEKCTHNLAVTIELNGSLENAKKYLNKEGKPIPPFHIEYADNDQEASVDDAFVVSCPPTTEENGVMTKFERALETGCEGKFGVNKHGGSCTEGKTATEKVEAEERAEAEAKKAEEETRASRERAEAEARAKWEREEKETKLTKAQREERERKEETKARWERQEGKGEITKAQREAKEETKAQLEKEEKEGKITKAQREERERKEETKARWERQEGKGEITKAQREAKEETKAQLEKEEKEPKLTKAQREAKEKEQAAARKAAEEAEAKGREKREAEERATKEARAKLVYECVGLVPVNNGNEPAFLTDHFQKSLSARVMAPPAGLKYYCPNKWTNNNSGGIPVIPPNDSRLVQFFAVPFGVTSFMRTTGSAQLVPIQNFATFYITGWDQGNLKAGQGSQPWTPKERWDACSKELLEGKRPDAQGELVTAKERAELENESLPLEQREQKEKEKGFDDNSAQPRELSGHLIKYVNVLAESGSGEGCKLESFETCQAGLTE
ncbi:MAG TPA: pilus assembly protein TadG-related protein [Solirubrobacteraceae bacterium]|nr:pilus assembly protein TadG-related protein [Solirubrobacteraceae bacterium]